VWSECRLFAHDPADATAIPSSLTSFKSRLVLPFWYPLSQVVLEKRPLNGCSSNNTTFHYCKILLVEYLNAHFVNHSLNRKITIITKTTYVSDMYAKQNSCNCTMSLYGKVGYERQLK